MIQTLKGLQRWSEFTVKHTSGEQLTISGKNYDSDVSFTVIYDSHECSYWLRVKRGNELISERDLKSGQVINKLQDLIPQYEH